MFAAQLEDIQPLIAQSIDTGASLTIQFNASVYNITYPLMVDFSRSQFQNISVTITGQGPDKTVLDCGGIGRAVVILGTGSVSVSNLTIQNCDLTKTRPGYPPLPRPLIDGAYIAYPDTMYLL